MWDVAFVPRKEMHTEVWLENVNERTHLEVRRLHGDCAVESSLIYFKFCEDRECLTQIKIALYSGISEKSKRNCISHCYHYKQFAQPCSQEVNVVDL
jgi:hypothetical protein